MTDRAQPSLLILIVSVFGLLLVGAALLFFLNRDMPKAPATASPPPSSAAPVQPLDQSAEERAYEAIRKVRVTPEATESTEKASPSAATSTPLPLAPPRRANSETRHETLPATTVALNCERLRKAYSEDELRKIPGFREKCAQ